MQWLSFQAAPFLRTASPAAMAPGEGRLTTSISRASTVQSAELAGMEVTAWVSVLHGQGSMLGTGSGGTERELCCTFPAIPVQWLLQRSQAEEGKQLGSKHIYSGKKLLSQCSSAMDWPRPQVMGDYNRTKLPVCFGLFWNFNYCDSGNLFSAFPKHTSA